MHKRLSSGLQTWMRPRLEILEAREVPNATLQVIHNSPYAAASLVDVYVNDALALDDVAFRTASPFLNVPSGVPLTVDITAANAADNSAPVFTATVTLAADSNNIAIALGDPTQTTGDQAFRLALSTTARTAAADPEQVDVLVVHGSPDAPPVDVKARLVGTVTDDIAFGEINPAGYLSLPTGKYGLDISLADGITQVASFSADLTDAAGAAITVLASGFVAPPAETDPGFGLLAVFADGTTALLPSATKFAEQTFAVGGSTGFQAYGPTGTPTTSVTKASNGAAHRLAVGDIDGDGVADFVVGSDPGGPSQVLVVNGATEEIITSFAPFEASFTGGIFVAAGDITGDGKADIVVSPDQGGGPRVTVFNGADFNVVANFFGIDDPNFRGGARTAIGDVNGNGQQDLVVAAGFGGGPRVAIFDGATVTGTPTRLVNDFFVFESTVRNGAYITVGDLNSNGFADIIAGGGPTGGPRVAAFSSADLLEGNQVLIANFFAGDPNGRDGVRLAAKDLDGDYQIDIVAGLGTGNDPQVRTFLGADLNGATPNAASTLNPFETSPIGGVFVG